MKKTTLITLMMFLCFNVISSSAGSEDKITEINFASEEWEEATNTDGTGLYWDIFRAVYEPCGIKVNFIIRSYSGSVELLKRQKTDAVVAAYLDEIEGALFPKWYFGVDIVQALFKKDKPIVWKGQETLKDKKVAWIKGYAYDEYLDVPVIKMEFDERKDALRVLDKDRIDFFLDARGDLLTALEDGYVDKTKYRTETVKQLYLYLAFVNSERGKRLKQIFDERLPQLIKSGEIKRIYDKWAKGNFVYPFLE
ncbi:MAG: transporter substrate-binding domain-containing protein [bacterium]